MRKKSLTIETEIRFNKDSTKIQRNAEEIKSKLMVIKYRSSNRKKKKTFFLIGQKGSKSVNKSI